MTASPGKKARRRAYRIWRARWREMWRDIGIAHLRRHRVIGPVEAAEMRRSRLRAQTILAAVGGIDPGLRIILPDQAGDLHPEQVRAMVERGARQGGP